MDKRAFLAVSICAGIFLLWNHFYLKPYTEQQQAHLAQQKQISDIQQPAPVKAAEPSKANLGSKVRKSAQTESIPIGGEGYAFQISTQGGVVSDVRMADYRGQKTDKINKLIGAEQQLEFSIPSRDWEYLSHVIYTVAKREADRLVLVYEDENLAVQRSYAVSPDRFSLEHELRISFRRQAPNYVYIGNRVLKDIEKDLLENERREVYFNKSGGQETWNITSVGDLIEDQGQGNWMGFASRYFLNALVNRSAEKPQFQARAIGNNVVGAGFFYPVRGSDLNLNQTLYYGPKDTDILKEVGNRLDSAVDFGWFTIFAYPMLTALKWFNKYVGNFGIAIILLTILVKLLTYPLTLKSMKSMKQMQRIQPQLQRLRERHKDDKERLNREMLQLMRSNGYNPMSGCLPIFIQMPIFIALYNVLYGAIDLYGQPFFGWIHDLSAKDPFYVTPVLLALMMFVQQKMTPTTAADPAQQRMMMMMPIIFGFMMLWLPAGLTLYMLVNSVVSVIQQVVINKTLDSGAGAAA